METFIYLFFLLQPQYYCFVLGPQLAKKEFKKIPYNLIRKNLKSRSQRLIKYTGEIDNRTRAHTRSQCRWRTPCRFVYLFIFNMLVSVEAGHRCAFGVGRQAEAAESALAC